MSHASAHDTRPSKGALPGDGRPKACMISGVCVYGGWGGGFDSKAKGKPVGAQQLAPTARGRAQEHSTRHMQQGVFPSQTGRFSPQNTEEQQPAPPGEGEGERGTGKAGRLGGSAAQAAEKGAGGAPQAGRSDRRGG